MGVMDGDALVNLHKLAKQLRREATKSPKKAAFLGLLAAVAIYFWAPLVLGWIAKKDSTPSASTASAPAAAAKGPVVAGATTSKPAETAMSWQDLLKSIEDDPRSSPVALRAGCNPFRVLTVETPKAAAAELQEKAAPPATPNSLGLVLAGTIIGPRGRVARLAGRTYAEGQTIDLAKGGNTYQFTLAEVHPHSVVLAHDGQRYELKTKSPLQNTRIEAEPAQN